MSKKNYLYFIFFYAIFLFGGCHAMAVLFHGEEPEESAATYLVAYDANGASGTVPKSQQAASGSVISLPNNGNLMYSGYVFIGWNENQSGAGTTYVSGSSITVTKNITFYAQWITSSTPQYTVSFNANGATGGSAPVSQTVYGGSSITLPGEGTLAFTGKNFTGWNTNAGGSGTSYSTGDQFTVTANITLFAQWADIPPEGTSTYAVNSVETLNMALQSINASSHAGSYIINISGEYVINQLSFAANAEKTIIFRGAGVPCVLYNGGTDPLFTVPNRITLKLENSITLNGNQKYYPAVKVLSGGTLNLKAGANITGAKNHGIWVNGGTCNMEGGSITGNYSGNSTGGGGVFIDNNGIFNLSDGTISDNTAWESGGGVIVENAAFNMTGGTIRGNVAGDINSGSYGRGGGGVMVYERGIFNMSGGTIISNTAQARSYAYGGGVWVDGIGAFTMSGGAITGNTAAISSSSGETYGGGVYVEYDEYSRTGIFIKNGGGTIADTNSAQYGKVACIYPSGISSPIMRNTTAGPSVNMNSAISGNAGGWE
jgi:uncharacterized repeat protein (TIGR02543 family)